MRNSSLAIAIIVGVFALAAFAYWPTHRANAADVPGAGGKPALATGSSCTVYFRGDAVGQSMPYSGSAMNNPSLSGTIISVDDNWLVIDREKDKEKKRHFIARSAILLVETPEKK